MLRRLILILYSDPNTIIVLFSMVNELRLLDLVLFIAPMVKVMALLI